ncbi:MAG TPA: hypothetical protein VJ957_00165, partial [Longimicrobiales bacterium]|nr:hypothetical protein [Longimicrobiales bacterium]
ISLLESAADAGLEESRALLNQMPFLFPDSGYVALEENAAVYDANRRLIPNVTRSSYAGPVGGGVGEYGAYGTIVVVARDGEGAEVIRRRDIQRESFAKYAYFTNSEGSDIAFGNKDQLYGPVHSNDNITIRSDSATFFGPVTTAGVIHGKEYATFRDGYTEGVDYIPMPSSSQLTALQSRATPGYMSFSPVPGGTQGESTMRIEFLALNVGTGTQPKGFFKVYRADSNPGYVTATAQTSRTAWAQSRNCGNIGRGANFKSAYTAYVAGGNSVTAGLAELEKANSRCFLGGADSLFSGVFNAADAFGSWVQYPGATPAELLASGRPDSAYLFPLDRSMNAGYRGVIYVSGKVLVSGVLAGRVTLAATGNIIIGDDVTYATDPSTGTCTDILGLWTADSVVVANNSLNAPQMVDPTYDGLWRSYDDTQSEFIQAVILANDKFDVESPNTGATTAEPCDGTPYGRGCIYLTGGIIQSTRGTVSYGTQGYMKRYSYDTCAADNPPPYFPSTGHFYRSRYYQVNPNGFNVAQYFQSLN